MRKFQILLIASRRNPVLRKSGPELNARIKTKLFRIKRNRGVFAGIIVFQPGASGARGHSTGDKPMKDKKTLGQAMQTQVKRRS
ncbi:MAG: hypothetical protein ACO2ER_10700, partial [Castellaniella sp.]